MAYGRQPTVEQLYTSGPVVPTLRAAPNPRAQAILNEIRASAHQIVAQTGAPWKVAQAQAAGEYRRRAGLPPKQLTTYQRLPEGEKSLYRAYRKAQKDMKTAFADRGLAGIRGFKTSAERLADKARNKARGQQYRAARKAPGVGAGYTVPITLPQYA